MPDPDFSCTAYGPAGAAVGALCFRSGESGKRVCADLGECHRVMSAERRRLFQRIQELAASGDETAVYLAAEFRDPGPSNCSAANRRHPVTERMASQWRKHANLLRTDFIGGEGCVIAAFDERRPQLPDQAVAGRARRKGADGREQVSDIVSALREWAIDANVRAAVNLLAEQDHWFWDEEFVAACVGQTGSTTWISWQKADAYLQSGPPCSGGEEAVLRVAIDLGSGRWQIDRLDGLNRSRVVAAVRQAVGEEGFGA